MEQVNPWTHVVSLLSHLASEGYVVDGEPWRAVCWQRPAHRGKLSEPDPARSIGGSGGRITAIETQDGISALVSWCDPTMCHYVDQTWTRVIARTCGYCALTGQRIQRGDLVFKPRGRGRHRPVNCDEMILAAALAP